jgi:hypothetical protein
MIDFKINRLLMLSVDHDYFDSKPVNNIDKLTKIIKDEYNISLP